MSRFIARALSSLAMLLLPAAAGAQIAGGMLVCDGISDFAVIPNDDEDLIFSTALTVEAWVRPQSFADFEAVVSGVSGAVDLQMTTPGRPAFTISVPTTSTATGPTPLVAGAWTHLAGTFDGTNIRIYVNGVLAATKSNPGDVNGFNALRLCRHGSSGGGYFHGAIDEVRIWEVVRSDAEIAAYYNRKIGGSQPGLVGYYRFDENGGQTLLDSSTAGNDGFLGSSPSAGNDDPTRSPSSAPLVDLGGCTPNAATACLLGGRFEVKVTMWNFATPPVEFEGRVQTYNGQSSATNQSVSFYSFENGNVEVFIKMVNACPTAGPAFWLFAAGATTAETEILVRDTVAEETVLIYNPRNVLFESVADVQAFKTCGF